MLKAGQVFSSWTVISNEPIKRNGNPYWLCRCECGTQRYVRTQSLVHGGSKSCGCHWGSISGKTFNSLTALYPLDTRDKKSSIIWHCRCECGNEVDLSRDALMFSNIRSCGCKKRKHEQNLHNLVTYVDGTSLDTIKSKKLRKDNTTGYKGVYQSRGRYMARIIFQSKYYHLGRYKTLEEAAAVRQMAEEALYGEIVRYYDLYKRKTAEDPDWAEKNPIRFNVKKDGADISVQITPAVCELTLQTRNE